MFFYFPPIPLSRIRYQEKEPNERELEELDIFFIFFGKKIRRAKRSKFNTNNITKTGNATAIYQAFDNFKNHMISKTYLYKFR